MALSCDVIFEPFLAAWDMLPVSIEVLGLVKDRKYWISTAPVNGYHLIGHPFMQGHGSPDHPTLRCPSKIPGHKYLRFEVC